LRRVSNQRPNTAPPPKPTCDCPASGRGFAGRLDSIVRAVIQSGALPDRSSRRSGADRRAKQTDAAPVRRRPRGVDGHSNSSPPGRADNLLENRSKKKRGISWDTSHNDRGGGRLAREREQAAPRDGAWLNLIVSQEMPRSSSTVFEQVVVLDPGGCCSNAPSTPPRPPTNWRGVVCFARRSAPERRLDRVRDERRTEIHADDRVRSAGEAPA